MYKVFDKSSPRCPRYFNSEQQKAESEDFKFFAYYWPLTGPKPYIIKCFFINFVKFVVVVIKSAASAASPKGFACRSIICIHRFELPGARSIYIF